MILYPYIGGGVMEGSQNEPYYEKPIISKPVEKELPMRFHKFYTCFYLYCGLVLSILAILGVVIEILYPQEPLTSGELRDLFDVFGWLIFGIPTIKGLRKMTRAGYIANRRLNIYLQIENSIFVVLITITKREDLAYMIAGLIGCNIIPGLIRLYYSKREHLFIEGVSPAEKERISQTRYNGESPRNAIAFGLVLFFGLIQAAAIFAGFRQKFGVIIGGILSLILGEVPILGSVMGYLGATRSWGWPWWAALILVLCGPVVLIVAGLMSKDR